MSIYTFHEDKTSRHGWMRPYRVASSTQIPLPKKMGCNNTLEKHTIMQLEHCIIKSIQ